MGGSPDCGLFRRCPRLDYLVEPNAGQECKGLRFLMKEQDQSW